MTRLCQKISRLRIDFLPIRDLILLLIKNLPVQPETQGTEINEEFSYYNQIFLNIYLSILKIYFV